MFLAKMKIRTYGIIVKIWLRVIVIVSNDLHFGEILFFKWDVWVFFCILTNKINGIINMFQGFTKRFMEETLNHPSFIIWTEDPLLAIFWVAITEAELSISLLSKTFVCKNRKESSRDFFLF